MIALKRIITQDKNLQLTQDYSQAAFTQVGQSPFVGGNLITTIPDSTGKQAPVTLISGQDNLIPHGLARPPSVYVITGQNAQSDIWSPATAKLATPVGTAQSANSAYLNLWCSSNCIVSLWVN